MILSKAETEALCHRESNHQGFSDDVVFTLRDSHAELRALVEKYQWADHDIYGDYSCPCCGAYKGRGHMDGCEIGEALK